MFIIFNSMNIIKYPSLLAIVLVVSCSCNSKKKSVVVWSKNFPVLGSESSPRTEDINKDGTLDVIMGAGKNEFQESDMGIVAFDGKTGEVIWKQSAPDQVFGSATFCDVTGDGVGDVFIGGRSPQLKAIDGSSGKLLWEYHADKFKNDSIIKYARYNFNNSVIIPDQNGDGINDLLTVNGGNALANPYETKNRFPGVLMIFDTKSGKQEASLDTCGDADDVFFDGHRHRIYVSCGEGVIDVLAASGNGYRAIADIPTVTGARTSLFAPALDRLYLGVRATPTQPAAIWVLRPQP